MTPKQVRDKQIRPSACLLGQPVRCAPCGKGGPASFAADGQGADPGHHPACFSIPADCKGSSSQVCRFRPADRGDAGERRSQRIRRQIPADFVRSTAGSAGTQQYAPKPRRSRAAGALLGVREGSRGSVWSWREPTPKARLRKFPRQRSISSGGRAGLGAPRPADAAAPRSD